MSPIHAATYPCSSGKELDAPSEASDKIPTIIAPIPEAQPGPTATAIPPSSIPDASDSGVPIRPPEESPSPVMTSNPNPSPSPAIPLASMSAPRESTESETSRTISLESDEIMPKSPPPHSPISSSPTSPAHHSDSIPKYLSSVAQERPTDNLPNKASEELPQKEEVTVLPMASIEDETAKPKELSPAAQEESTEKGQAPVLTKTAGIFSEDEIASDLKQLSPVASDLSTKEAPQALITDNLPNMESNGFSNTEEATQTKVVFEDVTTSDPTMKEAEETPIEEEIRITDLTTTASEELSQKEEVPVLAKIFEMVIEDDPALDARPKELFPVAKDESTEKAPQVLVTDDLPKTASDQLPSQEEQPIKPAEPMVKPSSFLPPSEPQSPLRDSSADITKLAREVAQHLMTVGGGGGGGKKNWKIYFKMG